MFESLRSSPAALSILEQLMSDDPRLATTSELALHLYGLSFATLRDVKFAPSKLESEAIVMAYLFSAGSVSSFL